MSYGQCAGAVGGRPGACAPDCPHDRPREGVHPPHESGRSHQRAAADDSLCRRSGARTGDPTRTIDVKLSRYAFSPERIEVRLGEHVWLNVVSVDGAHGFQVKELGLNARTPARGRTVRVELTPKEVGTFQITCSEYCGSGHSRMKAWLIVTPGT